MMEITSIIAEYKTKKASGAPFTILITGEHGCGKTTAAKELLKAIGGRCLYHRMDCDLPDASWRSIARSCGKTEEDGYDREHLLDEAEITCMLADDIDTAMQAAEDVLGEYLKHHDILIATGTDEQKACRICNGLPGEYLHIPIPAMSKDEIMKEFGVDGEEAEFLLETVGGNPRHIKAFLKEGTQKERIRDILLDPESLLCYETKALMPDKMWKTPVYVNLLYAIAERTCTLGMIKERIGKDHASLTAYLQNLKKIGVVELRALPGRDPEKSRYGTYHIKPALLRTWFRYCYENRDRIMMGDADALAEEIYMDIRLRIMKKNR